jgi:serine/threonine-protein kinase CLA4
MALDFLQSHGIAHRDVRSDNLLANRDGVIKLGMCVKEYLLPMLTFSSLADFSNAVKVSRAQPLCREPAGVIYWQVCVLRCLIMDVT